MSPRMASNGYNPYNYQNYPQNSGQQYTGYQVAPPASAPVQQNTRPQYQQAAPAAASQSTDYLSANYSSQSYNSQTTTYGRPQDNTPATWTGTNGFGANRETTRGAAEVLRKMSNTAYGSGSTQAAGQSGFTPANTATAAAAARYSTTSPAQHQTMGQPQQSHASHSYSQAQQQAHSHPQTQPQTQARPRSVNASRTQNTAANRGITSPAMAAGYPSQRTQNTYPQQTQRSQSPAQIQYANTSASAQVTSPQNVPRAPATQNQYQDYRPRQLPSVDASRNTAASTVSTTSYNYSDSAAAASVTQQPSTVSHSAPPAAEPFNPPTPAVTVDPMAVYNPYTEYERKMEERRQQEAARAEEERKAEELRKEEERKEEERRKAEEEERARQAAEQPAEGEDSNPSNPLEAEIRAMMAKMRELNSKDPALLARIWEEERRAKAPKSPATQNKTPQPAAAEPVAAPPAPSMVQRAPAQPKKAPARAAPPPARPQSVPMPAPIAVPPARPATFASSGNTVWPAEKKISLAGAATAYLNQHNPGNQISPVTIFSMLSGNPSYIELCEQLEAMGLKLDRAAFAKNLLTAVPDVNSASRPPAQARGQPLTLPVSQRPPVPPAAMMRKVGTPSVAQSPGLPGQSPMNGSFPPFPESGKHSNSQPPAPVAQMIPLKPELKPPANKEEAARKRTFSDLIDLTAVSDDDMEPFRKKPNVSSMYSYATPGPRLDDDINSPAPNFPVAMSAPPPPQPTQVQAASAPPPPQSFRDRTVVQPLEKKKALRRNGYNIATIARDVLLACGRHPEERQLNGHLEILKTTIPQITNESDLSTLRWDIIDPGKPPRGYYKDSSQTVEEDADDEDDSEDEAEQKARAQAASQARSAAVAPPQPLPPPTNPFAKKRGPGRPRHSLPSNFDTTTNAPSTPQSANTSAKMASSAPRPAAGSVGYSAFRAATEYGPDGKPLPRKRGRPVGWRKAIHGSAAAQARPNADGSTAHLNHHTPSQLSALRNVRSGEQDPITISSSPSASKRQPRPQSFKCKWHNCKVDLHNLETLRAHVFKLHRKETLRGTLDCLWGDCGHGETNVSNTTSMRVEKHTPFSFTEEAKWKEHLEIRHFSPLKWELGDGPASGLSGE